MSHLHWGRLGAISGLAFAVLFVLGVILPSLPGGGDSAEVVNAFYADSGNRMLVIVSAYIIVLAGLAFLVFVANLHRGLRQVEDGTGSLATMMLGAGFVFVAMLYNSSSAWGNVPSGIELGGEAQPGSEIPIWFTQLGYGDLLLYGMFAAIGVIVPASLLVLRSGVLPRWLAWTGFACAAVLVFGVVFIPMIALPIWTIATSVAMLRSREVRVEQATQPTPASV